MLWQESDPLVNHQRPPIGLQLQQVVEVRAFFLEALPLLLLDHSRRLLLSQQLLSIQRVIPGLESMFVNGVLIGTLMVSLFHRKQATAGFPKELASKCRELTSVFRSRRSGDIFLPMSLFHQSLASCLKRNLLVKS